jgi:hypothetical protein
LPIERKRDDAVSRQNRANQTRKVQKPSILDGATKKTIPKDPSVAWRSPALRSRHKESGAAPK